MITNHRHVFVVVIVVIDMILNNRIEWERKEKERKDKKREWVGYLLDGRRQSLRFVESRSWKSGAELAAVDG